MTYVTNVTTGILTGMTLLDSWTQSSHSADGVTHPTYRKGTGPGVIVIHEIPGLTPDVIAFGQEVVDAGFTVVMPHLFGTPERPMSPAYVGTVLPRLCVSREFTTMAIGRTSPVAVWLRSLARDAPRTSSVGRASAPSACASPAASRWR